MKPLRIERGAAEYPASVDKRLGGAAPRTLHLIGDIGVIRARSLGLLCSIRCPGSIVIQTFDAIRAIRDAGVVVAGGFQSPMESECLNYLLRGGQHVIMCPAKGLRGLRLGHEGQRAVKDGRLLLITPFGDETTRTVSAQAVVRNELVAALAEAVLVPHSDPGGKVDATANTTLSRGQRLFTFEDENNAHLIQAGAERYHLASVVQALGSAPAGMFNGVDAGRVQ